jgi:Ca2+:H+ antiporter
MDPQRRPPSIHADTERRNQGYSGSEARSSLSNILPTREKPATPERPLLFRIYSSGESGRKGVHPKHFLAICFRSTSTLSMMVNVLWPFVPAAIVLHFVRHDLHVWVFTLNYIAIVPTANLLGFAGGELARKLPKVWGIVLETTLTSTVEIVLFVILIIKEDGDGDLVDVIKDAILGSILANLLLCLGLCFFAGGMKRQEQSFHKAISEVGSGLLLVAGFGLLIPSVFYNTVSLSLNAFRINLREFNSRTKAISRVTSVILLAAFVMYAALGRRTEM